MANLSSFFGGGSGGGLTEKMADQTLDFLLTDPSVAEANTFFTELRNKNGLMLALLSAPHATSLLEVGELTQSMANSEAAFAAIAASPAATAAITEDTRVEAGKIIVATVAAMTALSANARAMTDIAARAGSSFGDQFTASVTAMNIIASSAVARNALFDSNVFWDYIYQRTMPLAKLALGAAGQPPASFSTVAGVAGSASAMASVAASDEALRFLFNATNSVGRTPLFNSAIAEKALRDTPSAMSWLNANVRTNRSVSGEGGAFVAMTVGARKAFMLEATTGYNSQSSNDRGASNFVHFQDGVTAAIEIVPNSPYPGNPWPLPVGRMMDNPAIMSRSGSATLYTRTAALVYMD